MAWAGLWLLFLAMQGGGLAREPAMAVAVAAGVLVSLTQGNWWRRAIVAAGFPLSALAAGLSMPPWAWALAVLPLLLAYPLRAWRDAPFFPTAHGALTGLERVIVLPGGAQMLDAGCGLGHGLAALRATWPSARLMGVEWSRPLAWLAARRCCPWAQVRRGDMWADDWSQLDLLYLFQRPESMPRAASKARAEMKRGSWIVSLAFAIPGWTEQVCLRQSGRRDVWVYRIP